MQLTTFVFWGCTVFNAGLTQQAWWKRPGLYLLRSQIFYEQQCLAATSSMRMWNKDAWHDPSSWQGCWQWHWQYFRNEQVEEEQPEQETQNPQLNTSRPLCQHSPLPASTVLHVRRHSTQPRRSQCWLPIVEQEDLPKATWSQHVWNFDLQP